MSFLSVVPDSVVAAGANLANIGSTLRSANAAAATQTTAIVAPAADEVSAAIATIFDSHGQGFQTLSAQAAAFHDEFVSLLNGGAAQYLSAELANAQQALTTAVNTPAQTLLGAEGANQAAANAAASGSSSTQTYNTPFGPITLTTNVTVPSSGNGPTSIALNAYTPLGNAQFSMGGTMTTTLVPPTQTTTITGGTLLVPPVFPFLLGLAGPYVTGGYSLYNSGQTFFTALGQGNWLGAASAFITAPIDFTNAVMFGEQTVTVPLGTLDASGNAGPTIDWNIPFSGYFGPMEPLSVSWSGDSYYDPSTLTTVTLSPANFGFGGTQFGGLGTQFLNALGIQI